MSLIIPANSASAAGGYAVDNSCRFNDGSSDNLSRTTETPTNADKYTFSVWVKRSNLGAANMKIFGVQGANANEQNLLEFNADDLVWQQTDSSGGNTVYRLKTDRKFRDPSAWYHIVVAYDSSQGTANNRIRMYINGVEETSFSTRTNPSANLDSLINSSVSATASRTLRLGRTGDDGSQYFDGYMSEVCFIDGLQLAPTSFGEFDEDSGIWKPIDGLADDLTFGNNGFYLDFKNSGALGADVSGNSNNFTVNNLAAVDQSTDTCTNNFATMNPLANFRSNVGFSEGNLNIAMTTAKGGSTSTFGLTTGKWYVEMNITTMPTDERFHLGIVPFEIQEADDPISANNKGIMLSGYNAVIYSSNSIINDFYGNNTTRFDSFTGIIGMALDMSSATKTITFSKAGAWVTGGGTTDTDFSNALKVDITSYVDAQDVWHIACGSGNGSGTTGIYSMNFGNPTFTGTDQSDGNSRGSFEYAPPSGYLSLCTANLSEVLG